MHVLAFHLPEPVPFEVRSATLCIHSGCRLMRRTMSISSRCWSRQRRSGYASFGLRRIGQVGPSSLGRIYGCRSLSSGSLVGRLALWYYLLKYGLIDLNSRPGFGRKARGKPTLVCWVLSPVRSLAWLKCRQLLTWIHRSHSTTRMKVAGCCSR